MAFRISRALATAALGALMLAFMVAPASALGDPGGSEPPSPRCDPGFQTCADDCVDGTQTCPEDPNAGCGTVKSCNAGPKTFTTGCVIVDPDDTSDDPYMVCSPSS